LTVRSPSAAVLIGDDLFDFASVGGADGWLVTAVTPDTRSKVRSGQVAAANSTAPAPATPSRR